MSASTGGRLATSSETCQEGRARDRLRVPLVPRSHASVSSLYGDHRTEVRVNHVFALRSSACCSDCYYRYSALHDYNRSWIPPSQAPQDGIHPVTRLPDWLTARTITGRSITERDRQSKVVYSTPGRSLVNVQS